MKEISLWFIWHGIQVARLGECWSVRPEDIYKDKIRYMGSIN